MNSVRILYSVKDELDINNSPFIKTRIFKMFYFLFNNGLIKVYTIRDIKHMRDNPHGFIVISGFSISIL